MLDYVSNNKRLVENILEHTDTGVCLMEYSGEKQDFVFKMANGAFYNFNSFVKGKVDNRTLLDLFPIATENGMVDFLTKVYKSGTRGEIILTYHHPLRGHVYQRIQGDMVTPTVMISIFNDITETENSKRQTQFEQQKFYDTINSLNTGIISTNSEGKIELINQYAQGMFGFLPEDTIGESIENLLTITAWTDNDTLGNMIEELQISTVVCANRQTRKAIIKTTDLIDVIGKKQGTVYAFEDMSDFMKAQEELLYINYHDIPTGFYNRTYLKLYLDKLQSQQGFGIIATDINGLKRINSVYGIEKGDQVIVICANAIKECVPADSVCIRFGEDDFIALIPPNPMGWPLPMKDLIEKIKRSYAIRQSAMGIDSSISFGMSIVEGELLTITAAVGNAQEKMLYNKVLEQKSVHSAALNSLLVTLQVRSHETEEHAQRLFELSGKITNSLDLGERDRHFLSLFAVLHDIGKIGVPDFVLNKPGKLTRNEWKIMKGHSDLGSRILAVTPELEEVSPLVRSHHERWDGSGYPDGLAGDDIPLLSRIIAVVDSYDAMTNDRIYRTALSKEEALAEIEKGAGTQFDPKLAAIFIEQMRKEK